MHGQNHIKLSCSKKCNTGHCVQCGSVVYTTHFPLQSNTDGTNVIIPLEYMNSQQSVSKTGNNICGNKMPTRCNRGFYCRSYCLLNMFRVPLCPSSGAQEYYTVVAACGISCCGFQVAGLVWSWGLCVRFAKPLLRLVGFLFPHINDDARSKSNKK